MKICCPIMMRPGFPNFDALRRTILKAGGIGQFIRIIPWLAAFKRTIGTSKYTFLSRGALFSLLGHTHILMSMQSGSSASLNEAWATTHIYENYYIQINQKDIKRIWQWKDSSAYSITYYVTFYNDDKITAYKAHSNISCTLETTTGTGHLSPDIFNTLHLLYAQALNTNELALRRRSIQRLTTSSDSLADNDWHLIEIDEK